MIRILYHGNCFDGMAAAWAAWRKFGDSAEYKAVNYGDKDINDMMQDCYENSNINDDLYIVDFSFPLQVLEALHNKVKKLVVLDHHKTAEADLKGLDYCQFDMDKSGARLSWEYFHGPNNIPKLIEYIEDRDLWRFQLEHSHEINAFIQSYPMTITDYALLHQYLTDQFNTCLQQGFGIARYKNTMVETMCKSYSIQNVGGYDVPVVNATILFSEVGNMLCQLYPQYKFAAYFTVKSDGNKQWGLRSIGDFDVSKVAKELGGGGHKNASGFIGK